MCLTDLASGAGQTHAALQVAVICSRNLRSKRFSRNPESKHVSSEVAP